jgi:hypothetical protein
MKGMWPVKFALADHTQFIATVDCRYLAGMEQTLEANLEEKSERRSSKKKRR